MKPTQRTYDLIHAIIEDLNGRKGFDFDILDDEVREELIDDLAEIRSAFCGGLEMSTPISAAAREAAREPSQVAQAAASAIGKLSRSNPLSNYFDDGSPNHRTAAEIIQAAMDMVRVTTEDNERAAINAAVAESERENAELREKLAAAEAKYERSEAFASTLYMDLRNGREIQNRGAGLPDEVHSIRAQRDSLAAEVERLREALKGAAKTFRRYAEIHRTKPDLMKAMANEAEAERCESALKGAQ